MNKNADSGKSSYLPSKISLNPFIVSFTETYFPGIPVNCSPTVNGCDKNLCTFLALETTALSSSDNSSTPNIAIISCNSLYLSSMFLTFVATL
ncbi:Uncharacterised protein [Clostridioides difficile]|nr:Uncharacterised protein [Clostridioides difficile]